MDCQRVPVGLCQRSLLLGACGERRGKDKHYGTQTAMEVHGRWSGGECGRGGTHSHDSTGKRARLHRHRKEDSLCTARAFPDAVLCCKIQRGTTPRCCTQVTSRTEVPVKFTTTLLKAEDMNATGIVIPPEIIATLGGGKRAPVRVTINGYTYRNTVAVMGGQFMVGVAAEHRKQAKVKGGDTIEVTIELDDAPRTVDVPVDFAAALCKAKAVEKILKK